MRVAAYVYPGWHPIPERDLSFHPGFTEWELVTACAPRFAGHAQPRLPAWGPYDDRVGYTGTPLPDFDPTRALQP